MLFKEIIAKYTDAGYSEPSETAVRYFVTYFEKLFHDIGYVHTDIPKFNKIIEFMARHALAVVDHEQAQAVSPESDFGKIYAAEIKDKKFRFPKGLLFCGHYGTGKTLAARVIADYFGLSMIDTYAISLEYQKKDGNDWLAKWLFSHCQQTIIIDDIGAEGDIKKFGNESPISAILATRARFWEQYGVPTIYTTNFMTPRALAEAYGNNERLLDRLTSYQVPVTFSGQSRRQ